MFYNLDVLGSIKQKCIPVGCVPPTSVAVSGEGRCLPGVSAQGCLPRGVCPRGVCRGGGCVCHKPPPTCGQTDACENITLLEASFAGCKYLPNRSDKCFYLMMRNRKNPARSRKAESDPTVRFLRFRRHSVPSVDITTTVIDLMYLRQYTGLLKTGIIFTLFNKINLSLS